MEKYLERDNIIRLSSTTLYSKTIKLYFKFILTR